MKESIKAIAIGYNGHTPIEPEALRYIVKSSFGGFKKGEVVAMTEDKAHGLLVAGKIAELEACPICHEYGWWLSKGGQVICGVCRPPARVELEQWIGGRKAFLKKRDRLLSMEDHACGR